MEIKRIFQTPNSVLRSKVIRQEVTIKLSQVPHPKACVQSEGKAPSITKIVHFSVNINSIPSTLKMEAVYSAETLESINVQSQNTENCSPNHVAQTKNYPPTPYLVTFDTVRCLLPLLASGTAVCYLGSISEEQSFYKNCTT